MQTVFSSPYKRQLRPAEVARPEAIKPKKVSQGSSLQPPTSERSVTRSFIGSLMKFTSAKHEVS